MIKVARKSFLPDLACNIRYFFQSMEKKRQMGVQLECYISVISETK